MTDELTLLSGPEVQQLLTSRSGKIIAAVEAAYVAHDEGKTAVPHSSFLRFPNDDRNRIIALPAWLGEGAGLAGLKWISSFPSNGARGLNRASAVMVMNDMSTGRATTILEASIISAKRTAASAAAFARLTCATHDVRNVSLLGAGVINLEVIGFLREALPTLRRARVYDLDRPRAEKFARVCEKRFEIEVTTVEQLDQALADVPVVSIATTALVPHICSFKACVPDATILHLSLRDIQPNLLLDCFNVVDDVEHALRERTSLALAAQQVGHRDFIAGTIGQLLRKKLPLPSQGGLRIFSPFGLGILDLAVASVALEAAREERRGSKLANFWPAAEL